MITLNEICIISVLDDAQACLAIFWEDLHKISGALTIFQLREIIGLFNFFNMSLAKRPVFHSTITPELKYRITASTPETWKLLNEKDQWVSPGPFLVIM